MQSDKNYTKKWLAFGMLFCCSISFQVKATDIDSQKLISNKILVVGDSLSAEYGLAHDTGWVFLLAQKLNEQKSPYVVLNSSISGETTAGGLQRLPLLIEKNHPRVLIIELGANDALRGLALEDSRQNLQRMIQMTKAYGGQILLLGMEIPPNYGKNYTQSFKKMYPQISEKYQISLVPFFLEGVALNPNLFQSDRLHPNEKAQPILLKNVLPKLLPLLSHKN